MNTSSDDKNAMVNLALKKILYNFPVAGPVLEVLFEFRGKVKQDRFNKFVALLEEEFKRNGVDPEKLNTEGSVDLFESIVRKATDTRSTRKREYFKNLLIRGFNNQTEIDFCEIFGELLVNMHEKEIEILKRHQRFLHFGKGFLEAKSDLKNELEKFKRLEQYQIKETHINVPGMIYKARTEMDINNDIEGTIYLDKEYKHQCTPEQFGVSPDQYKYFLQNLFSKGLLFDSGVGRIDTSAFEIMTLTQFGHKFLEFIER